MQSVIVLGASARAAAFSIRRAGYQPYAMDLFADRDLAALCTAVKIRRYPHDFLALLAAAPDSPWIYTGGLENHPRLVDRLAEVRPLLGNRGAVLGPVRDLQQLAEAARDAGCSFPSLGSTSGLSHSAQTQWLFKPRHSSGGMAVRFARGDETARPPRGTYLQQYIAGESASAVFVAAAGRATLLGVTRQLIGRDFRHDQPFIYVGSIGPLLLQDADFIKLNRLGHVLAERFGLVGLYNVDFVRSAGDIWPVEVNPRYSASVEVLELITRTSFVELHLQACENNRLPTDLPAANEQFAGKATVYARKHGCVPPALDERVAQWNLPGQCPGLADLPQIGDRFVAGQPIVTVLCSGSTLDQVDTELRRRVADIESLLSHHGL